MLGKAMVSPVKIRYFDYIKKESKWKEKFI
nr:MAG TPA: hypothetical protein [Caudoviricetes sp.]